MEEQKLTTRCINKMKRVKRKLVSKMRKFYRKFFYGSYPLMMKLKLKNETVIFESFLGRKSNDSPRAIYEYMLSAYPELDYVWIVDNPENFDIPGARLIKRLTPKYFFAVARSKYIINNSRMPIFFKKRDEQVYIQTWHGTPLKRLVFDMENNLMPGTNQEKYLANFSREVNNWDYLVSPNHYSTEKFKTAFRFEHKFLEVGYPRNEFLHNHTKAEAQQLRNKYGIKADEVAILYTPTYRDNHNEGKGRYLQEIKLDLDQLNNTPGIKVLMRVHYLVSQNLQLENYPNIIDVSDVNDINELYIASDVLLNDYSSTMFDYLILDKPIILFPYDLDEYTNDIRGFYMDYNLLPAEQISSTTRLIEIAQNLQSYQIIWAEQMSKFKSEMVLEQEGHASQLIVDEMFKHKATS